MFASFGRSSLEHVVNSEMLIFLGMAAAMLIVCIVLVVFVLRALKNPRVASSVDASRAREDELRSHWKMPETRRASWKRK